MMRVAGFIFSREDAKIEAPADAHACATDIRALQNTLLSSRLRAFA